VEITEVRIKLMDDPHDRLQAFCSVTLDGCFVIRDLKIIQGTKGAFVAMPSRKLTDRCPNCYTKNHLRAVFCNDCGVKLGEERAVRDQDGRAKLYADIAHPINSACRDMIQQSVLDCYEREVIQSRQPGYVCSYDDYGEEQLASLHEAHPAAVSTIERDSGSHRIEPAAPHPGPPHHHLSAESPEYASRPSPGTTADSRDADADDFGAGIV